MPFMGSVEGKVCYGRQPIISVNPIVTTGLQLYLDAGNSSSYNGSGSTWTDLSPFGRNATLINSPSYSSANSGSLSFLDTSLQYATVPNIGNLSTWTIEAWANLSLSLTGKVTSIVCNQFDLVNKLNFSLGTNNATANYNLAVGYYNGAWRTTTGITPTLNTWTYYAGTYNGTIVRQYTNNAEVGTLSYTGTPQSGGEIRIARRWDETTVASNFLRGNISVIRIYNRALSAAELLQNYNAQKGRY
jgi:hypothetical protein